MTWPGQWLRSIAIRVFSEKTIEQVIDPTLADVHVEYLKAVENGSRWTRNRVRLIGCVSLFRAVVSYSWGRAIRTAENWRVDAQPAVGQLIGCLAAAILCALGLLMLPLFKRFSSPRGIGRLELFMYLIPSQLPLAVPMGFSLGILCLRGQLATRRLNGTILAAAIVCSLAMLATTVWLIPTSNQAFRVATRMPQWIEKGAPELTLSQLSKRIDELTREGRSAQSLKFAYHYRWALPCATLVLAFFALSLAARRRNGAVLLVVAGVGALLAYYFLMFGGRLFAMRGWLPAEVGAWLPNIVMTALAMTLRQRGLNARWPENF